MLIGKAGHKMKRGLATALTAVALLAIVGSNMITAGDREPEQVPQERAGVIHAADNSARGSASAIANRNLSSAANDAASALKAEDAQSLRLELIACLLTMLIVTAGALLGICYFGHRTVRRQAWPTSMSRGNRPQVDVPRRHRFLCSEPARRRADAGIARRLRLRRRISDCRRTACAPRSPPRTSPNGRR